MRLCSLPSLWLCVLASLTLLVNFSPWNHVRPITPAILLYAFQDSLLPVLVSPFLAPSWLACVARILQLGWIATQPPSARLTLVYFLQLYPAVLAARAGTGFIFGRSVGWKYPHLFSHTAVYEPIAGFGPILLGSLLFDGVLDSEKRHALARVVLMFAFVLLDGMPWAYMCGAAITGLHRLLHASLFEGKYIALPRHTPTSSPERKSGDDHNSPPLSKRRIFLTSILALLVVGLIGNLPGFLTSLAPHKPPQPQNVHVVMLTVPRLRDLTSDVLIDSIQSYTTPWRASSNFSSSLTVFAHVGSDGNHAAFDRANAYFHTSADVNTRALPVTFHIEPPPAHEEPVMNHHAHLADAVKYARKSGEEWTMFVEDDFVLCGEWGWESLMRIMERLSEVDGDRKRLNGGFIGTGGSGIIFHRSILPTLEQTLSVLALMNTEESKPMPPDVLMQQCLTGELQFCPNDGYVISSRMLMGHRGGQISTGDRLYEDGKWECGWRHPQHGNKGAEVIVV